MSNGMTLRDLPLDMQNNILYKFSDACDIINLGQATPTLHMLSEDRHLWKKLCQFHFAEKQVEVTGYLNMAFNVISVTNCLNTGVMFSQ